MLIALDDLFNLNSPLWVLVTFLVLTLWRFVPLTFSFFLNSYWLDVRLLDWSFTLLTCFFLRLRVPSFQTLLRVNKSPGFYCCWRGMVAWRANRGRSDCFYTGFQSTLFFLNLILKVLLLPFLKPFQVLCCESFLLAFFCCKCLGLFRLFFCFCLLDDHSYICFSLGLFVLLGVCLFVPSFLVELLSRRLLLFFVC